MSARHEKVIIIGSGPAGYTAGIYAARAMLSPLIISGIQPGGQLTITTEVENYPGFAEPPQGPWLMEQMREQAEKMGAAIISDHITEVDLDSRPFRLKGDGGQEYTCDALIIATGAQAMWLGLESEEKFKGFGVSACATCDGFFYRGKKVIVVGGGNTAVEEAIFLTNFASEVFLVHRRDELRAEKVLQKRVMDNPKVTILWDTVIEEILGEEMPKSVTGVKLRNVKTGEITRMGIDGVFIAIGHKPSTGMFEGKLELLPGGYIKTACDSTATSVPGVFAAGDVADPVYKQAVTAAGMGCMAALEAERFLVEEEG